MQNIDYKVGDWVETCHIMPGIVQVIDKKEDTVEIYYPHYKKKEPTYAGSSCCSITHCGVHKIDSELANAFLKVGEERATRVYYFLQRNFHIKGIEKSIQLWEEYKNEWENIPFDKLKIRYYNFNKKSWKTKSEQQISNIQDFYRYELDDYENILKQKENELINAWENFHKLYHQTIKDLAHDVINNITKGIWLSYQKHTLERQRDGIRIIELVKTGERFLVKKYKSKRYKKKSYDFYKKLN